MTCNLPQRKRYDYPQQLQGTTVNALTVVVCRNDLPETDFTILVEVKDHEDVVVFTHTPALVDNVFVIPSMNFPNEGKFSYDAQFTYPDGTVKVYMFGDIPVEAR